MRDNQENNKDFYNIHLKNYRIAFDSMRAYHTLEIKHKKRKRQNQN